MIKKIIFLSILVMLNSFVFAQIKSTQKSSGTKNSIIVSSAILDTTFNEKQVNEWVIAISKSLASRNKNSYDAFVQQVIKISNDSDFSYAYIPMYLQHRTVASLILALEAYKKQPDAMLLNNIASMLIDIDDANAALPILKFLNQLDPNNGLIQNNLGQAYLVLGKKDKAQIMFIGCIRSGNNNPQASCGMGIINEMNGNTQQAIEYYQQSLEQGYNNIAADRLSKLCPACDIEKSISLKIPEPPSAEMFAAPQIPHLLNEINSFNKQIDHEIQRLQHQLSTVINDKIEEANHPSKSKGESNWVINSSMEWAERKYKKEVASIENYLVSVQQSYLEKLNQYYVYITSKRNALDEQFQKEDEECNKMKDYEQQYNCQLNLAKRKCAASKALSIEALDQFKSIFEPYAHVVVGLINSENNTYYKYFPYQYSKLSDKDKQDEINSHHFLYTSQIINVLGQAQVPVLIDTACYGPDALIYYVANVKKQTGECTNKYSLDFIVGSISAECSKFKVSAKIPIDGIPLSIEYGRDFKTHQHTIAVGVGFGPKIDIGPVSLKMKATASLSMNDLGEITAGSLGANLGIKTPVGAASLLNGKVGFEAGPNGNYASTASGNYFGGNYLPPLPK
jgi:tetratricopeptide (TPR) repeat protein